MKRAAIWFVVNGLMAYLLYAGFYEGVEGARNVFRFMVWLSFFLTLCAALVDDITKTVQAKGESVPSWLSLTYDGFMLASMVWLGLWASGIAYLLTTMLQYGIHHPDKKEAAA